MEKEFVPYELAVKLKALGFDEPCLAYYEGNELTHGMLNDIGKKRYLQTPLFQQAFRWFREKHNLHCAVNTHTSSTNQLTYICSLEFGKKLTYEEAELACLNKLIEIVEAKSE